MAHTSDFVTAATVGSSSNDKSRENHIRVVEFHGELFLKLRDAFGNSNWTEAFVDCSNLVL